MMELVAILEGATVECSGGAEAQGYNVHIGAARCPSDLRWERMSMGTRVLLLR